MSQTNIHIEDARVDNTELDLALTGVAVDAATEFVSTKLGGNQHKLLENPILELWKACKSYGMDWRISRNQGSKRAPRIPNPILDGILRLDVDFNRAVSTLGVTPNHLRNALAQRGATVRGEGDHQVASAMPVDLAAEAGHDRPSSGSVSDLRRVRGEDAKLRVHLAVLEYYDKHEEFPSLSHLRRNHRIARATAAKYWPTLAELGIETEAPVEDFAPVIEAATSSPVAKSKLVAKISSLVFGDELVDGTYDDEGVIRCDFVQGDAKGPRPQVHAWRKQQKVVAEIIRLADELQVAL